MCHYGVYWVTSHARRPRRSGKRMRQEETETPKRSLDRFHNERYRPVALSKDWISESVSCRVQVETCPMRPLK